MTHATTLYIYVASKSEASPPINSGHQVHCSRPIQTFGSSGFSVVSDQSRRAQVSMATSEKQVVVVGIDDYDQSTYALQWTLHHFFASGPNPLFKLVLVHAKPSATSVVGLAGPGAADVLPIVDADLRQIAARVVQQVKNCAPANW